MELEQNLSGIKTAVDMAGSQRKLAERLGCSQQAISLWVAQGWVPLRRAEEIEQKLSIPCARLVNPRIVQMVAAGRSQT